MKDDYFNEQFNIAQSSKDALRVKTAVSAAAAVIMLVLSVINVPLIAVAIAGIVCCIIVSVFCMEELFKIGLPSIFSHDPSNDAFNVFALIAAFFQSVTLLFSHSVNTHPFCFVVFASISVSMAMKYLFVSEITNNLLLVKNNPTYSVNIAELSLKKKYYGKVCLVNPVKHFPNIVKTTYSGDPSEQKLKTFVPIVCVAILILSVILGLINGFDVFSASFAALSAAAASFAGEMAYVLPYASAQRRLRKKGSVLLGMHSIDNLQNVETLAVGDSDLFPAKLTEFELFRVRDLARTSDAVEYTATLLLESKSPFAQTFIESCGCNPDRLPPVDEWKFQKDYGIVATIYGDSVILGNRNMLLSYDILPLPQEAEASLVSTNRNILYIAINGKVAGYTVMRYACDPEMRSAAESVGTDFSILVSTKDGNITEQMIQKRYELRNTRITVLDSREMKDLRAAKKALKESEEEPVMITTKNAIGILSSVRIAKSLGGVVNLSVLTKLASIVFGILLTTVAFFIRPSAPSGLWVLIFNAIWSVPVIFLSLVRK